MATKKKDIPKELEEVIEVEENTPAVEEVEEPKSDTFVGVVKCDRLNVRALSDKTSRIVTVLTKGQEIELTEIPDNKDWYQYTGVGFVMAEFIKRM